MRKKLIISGIIIIVLIVFIYFTSNQNNPLNKAYNQANNQTYQEIQEKIDSYNQTDKGYFTSYSTSTFNTVLQSFSQNKVNPKVLLLYFGATPSQDSATTFNILLKLESANIPDGMIILSVDSDKYPELKNQYGIIDDQNSFINGGTFIELSNDGKIIKKWSNGDGDIIQNIVQQLKS